MGVVFLDKQEYDVTVPILIIGAGACGISAAISAKENGIEAMVLERDQEASGSSALSTCLIPGAGTELQREAGVEDSPELFAADIIAKAKDQTDPEMARWVAEASGPTVDWLAEKVGLELSLLTGFYYPGHTRYRMHGSPNRTGSELMATLNNAISRASIDLITSALVTHLYADSESRIHGVGISRPDNTTEVIGCRSLILACNGYGGNPEMVRKHIPEMANALYFGHTGNKGDAVNWGTELGAGTADMGGYQGHGAVTHPHGTLLFWGLLTEGGIQVNSAGERFSNEVRGYSEQAVDVISQTEGCAWEIWDYQSHTLGLTFQDYRNGQDIGALRKSDNIPGIAEQTGLPVSNLRKAFEEIEHCINNKKKDHFGRSWAQTRMMQPPYYFARVTGALFHTQGGLMVNNKARVLRENRVPLPNLFAGGGAARGLSGPSRWGYLSGNGLLTATVLGRIAGQEAVRLISS